MKKIFILTSLVFCATVLFSGCTLPKIPQMNSSSSTETKTETKTTQLQQETEMSKEDTTVTTTEKVEVATPTPTSTDINSLQNDLDTFTLENETFK